MEMFFLAWDLSQMPPGQSFEMTQEKPVSLIFVMQKVKEISLPHYQSVSSSNEYAPVCNTKMINIDLNEFWHSLPAKNINLEKSN